MNSFINIMNKIIISVDRLINSISPTMSETIKRGYFFFMFLLAIVALIIGSNLGKESARIKGSMIIESTNEAFKYTIKKERVQGTFQDMIDSELISEPGFFEHERKSFRIKEPLEQEPGQGIIEAERHIRAKTTPDIEIDDRPAEGRYRPSGGVEPDVKPIERGQSWRSTPEQEDSAEKDIRDINSSSDESVKTIQPETGPVKAKKQESRVIKIDPDRKIPAPIKKDQGALTE